MASVHGQAPFEIGLAVFDAQHRELFEALGRLTAALRDGAAARVAPELSAMARHAIRHCQAEETLMKELDFPGRLVHADEHQQLIRQLRDLEYRHLRGEAVELEVTEFLGGWLDHHIRESDWAYAEHLRAGGRA